MSCVSSISAKRTRLADSTICEKEDYDSFQTPVKKSQKRFHKWSLSIATPTTSPVNSVDTKRKTKSLDNELFSSPLAIFGTDPNVLNAEFQNLTLESAVSPFASSNASSSPVFHMPELLHRVFKYLNPESLYHCSKVNRIWQAVASSIINQDLVVQQHSISGDLKIVELDGKVHPSKLTFYRLKEHRHFVHNQLPELRFSRLKTLNFYISSVIPNIFDSYSISDNLTKLTIAGNKKITDTELIPIVMGLPNLVELDLRACSQISDVSVVSIVSHCPKLESINLGRHENPELVTDLSITALSELENLTTLGISGCSRISDVSIWQLYEKFSKTLARLSLNGCSQITDSCITQIIARNGFPNLTVLDIRNCSLIHFKQLIQYRDWRLEVQHKPIDIHLSDDMKSEFDSQEQQLHTEYKSSIMKDLLRWVNE